MKLFPVVLGLSGLLFAVSSIAKENESILYSLTLPDAMLSKENSQAVEEINFKLACGHVEAISYIPELWNVNIVRAVSLVEEFSASSGLGAANLQLEQYRKMQKAITISTTKDCKGLLNLSGSVIVNGPKVFEIKLDNNNLKLISLKN